MHAGFTPSAGTGCRLGGGFGAWSGGVAVPPHRGVQQGRLLLVPRRAGGGVGGRRRRTTRSSADRSRLGDAGSEGGPALGTGLTSVRHGCDGRRRTGRWTTNCGAPLPGAPNVGFRVPAKLLRFEHWGAHEDLPLPNHALSLTVISRPSSTNTQHKRHEIDTGSGHRCGVIAYSSVVWWIASRADDE